MVLMVPGLAVGDCDGSVHGLLAGAWSVIGSGQGSCWVAALEATARFVLADFFSTISHCPWRDFISRVVRWRLVGFWQRSGLMPGCCS